ncbi:MAG: glycosyltransferase family 2 protein [Lachnospiraceae bacterium]|nr:glycosyltransferase family 2 protein [Lachnospiraceae bacterium]
MSKAKNRNTDKIRFSVAMCTYNGEAYIREQLQSILEQDVPVDEIVLADDGSTDGTVRIAREVLSQSSVSYEILVNKKNLGFRKNFEQAIARTHGEIIFLSDQDDVWKREKVRVIWAHFQKNPSCLLVFSNAVVVDANRNPQAMDLWDSLMLNKETLADTDWKRLFLKGWYVTGAATAIRRELFEEAIPFPEICYHDAWLAMRAALRGGLEAEPEKLICYRQHADNQIGTVASGAARWKKRLLVLRTAGQTQIEIHRQYAVMYREIDQGFSDLLSADPDFYRELKACAQYHQELGNLGNLRFRERLQVIWHHYRQGDFSRFAKNQAALRGDLFYAMGRRAKEASRRK